MKVTNSLYENILCLTFENGWIYNVLRYLHSDGRTKVLVWILVSPRGVSKLKTTLHVSLLMVDSLYRLNSRQKSQFKLEIVYLIKQDIHIYMFQIAGQTAGLIGLKFLWTLMGGQGVLLDKKKLNAKSGPLAIVFTI